MLTSRRRVLSDVKRGILDRRAVAALEFALVAPLMVLLFWGVYDLARALIAWEETCASAQQIAQAAEKLSVTAGSSMTSLTSTQMQDAMTTIYAQMPGLNLGNGTGSMTGAFAVTLSGVAYKPLCPASGGCGRQAPSTLWSTYLTEGGAQLNAAPVTLPLLRRCGGLTPTATFPNDATQLLVMIVPAAAPLTPQVVADVQYVFTFSLPLLALLPGLNSGSGSGRVTFYASASMPAPYGDNTQEITFNSSGPPGNVVVCP